MNTENINSPNFNLPNNSNNEFFQHNKNLTNNNYPNSNFYYSNPITDHINNHNQNNKPIYNQDGNSNFTHYQTNHQNAQKHYSTPSESPYRVDSDNIFQSYNESLKNNSISNQNFLRNQTYQSLIQPIQENQRYYNIPNNTDQGDKKTSESLLTRSTKFSQLVNELDFDGNVRKYYLKYIDNNSALMPMNYRRKIDLINKVNFLVPTACIFNIIMSCVNYYPENIPLAKKNLFLSSLIIIGTIYYSKSFIKQYQIESYNEMLHSYSENKIKEMVDKSIMINRTL